MEELIYSIRINGIILQLEENSLGYCVTVIYGKHSEVFIYSTIDESLDKMQTIMNQI